MQDLVDRVIDVHSVADQQAGQHRDLDVVLLRDLRQRAQILRQAGAAEGEARLQVGRRNVQARVGAHQPHDFVRIDAQRLRHAADLVGERDLERVEGIAAHLERFGHADAGHQEARLQVLEDLAHRVDRRLAVAADDGVRRMVVVADRAAFAQEFRLEARPKSTPDFLPLALSRMGSIFSSSGAGLHRGADHDGVELALGLQRRADLFGQPQDGAQVLAAIGGRRRAHAHERHLACRAPPARHRW